MNEWLAIAQVSVYWHLPPLVAAVSLVYSATRYESWSLILPRAIQWTVYILGFLGIAYGAILALDWVKSFPHWLAGMIAIYWLTRMFSRKPPAPANAKTAGPAMAPAAADATAPAKSTNR